MELAVALVDESKTEKKARLERLIMDRDSLQLEHDNLVQIQMKVFSGKYSRSLTSTLFHCYLLP